jgi:hypothetical protein
MLLLCLFTAILPEGHEEEEEDSDAIFQDSQEVISPNDDSQSQNNQGQSSQGQSSQGQSNQGQNSQASSNKSLSGQTSERRKI